MPHFSKLKNNVFKNGKLIFCLLRGLGIANFIDIAYSLSATYQTFCAI